MAIGDSAYKVYSQGQTRGEIDAVPRNKYSFTVSLNYIDGAEPLSLVRIANVQIPTYVYRSQTLNAYNAKKTVLTGIDYTPITITAYDTKDAVFEKFLKDYTAHYVDGPLNDADYNAFLTNPKGIKTPESRNYIRSIVINRKDSKNLESVIEIYNPYILNIDSDTLDYSDSSPAIYRVTFTYEGFKILSSGSATTEAEVVQAEEFANIPPPESTENEVDEKKEYDVKNSEEINELEPFGGKGGNVTSNQAPITEVSSNPDNLQRFTGTLKKGEKIRNINGKSYLVPAPKE